MDQSTYDRTLALAGIFQAAYLIQQLARDGEIEPKPFAASIKSVLITSASDTADVYGGEQNLELGLRLLRNKLNGDADSADLEMAKYVIAMMQHANKLSKNSELLGHISKGIDTINEQMEFFASDEKNQNGLHPLLVEKMAELYAQTVSTLSPRIIINGEEGYLSDPKIASKVRAGLFAGIRSAFLWAQLGGKRWHLLFGRNKTVQAASEILTHDVFDN